MKTNVWIIAMVVLLLVLGMIIFGIFYKKEYLTMSSQYSDFIKKLGVADQTRLFGGNYTLWNLISGYEPHLPLGNSIYFYTRDSKLYVHKYQIAITFKGSDAFLHIVDDSKLGKPHPISVSTSRSRLHIGNNTYVPIDL